MKVCIILLFCLFSMNCFADDIRMATSEDIDLFDKALESSERLIKEKYKDSTSSADSKVKSKAEREEKVEGDHQDKVHFKRKKISRDDNGEEQIEESARNKRKNKKRQNP